MSKMTSEPNTTPDPTQLDNVSGEPIYLLSKQLLWRNFKRVYDRVAIKDGGPTPVHFDKTLWQMSRDGLIFVWLDGTSTEDTIFTGRELPKNRPVHILTNPKSDHSPEASTSAEGLGGSEGPLPGVAKEDKQDEE